MSFSENLRAARERSGLTQQQVADLMGIDKSTYCGYETEKRQPDVQKLKKLSKILGVSGDELLETGYKVRPTPVSESGPLSPDDARIMDMIRQLSPENKRKIAEKLEVLIEFQAPAAEPQD